MEPSLALSALRKRWYVPLIGLLLGAALAIAYTSTLTKVYTASAKIFVSANVSSEESAANAFQWRGGVYVNRFGTYAEMASTPVVLDPVAQDFGGEIPGAVTAEPISDTALIEVTATGSDPNETAALANATAKELGATIVDLETPRGERSPVSVSTVTPATPPSSPIAPRPASNILVGSLLGLVLGFGLVLLREGLDRSVRGSSAVERLTGSVPLSVVGSDPGAKRQPLVSLDQQAPRSEAFRILRANLQYVDVDNPPKIIAVTSSVPGEGKTTTACNLSITMAQAGLRVCLVDADLRRPRAEEYMGLDDSSGLTDVLAGRLALEQALIPWHRGLLSVLPSGPKPPNPSELLGSQHMQNLLAELRSQFDIVIVDTAPLLLVADGSLVAAASEGAVLLIRDGNTTVDQVNKALETLKQVDAQLLGSILNFAPVAKKRGYGYGYGYGSGEDGGGDDAKPKKASESKRSSGSEPVGAGSDTQ